MAQVGPRQLDICDAVVQPSVDDMHVACMQRSCFPVMQTKLTVVTCGTGATSSLSPVCALVDEALTDLMHKHPDQRVMDACEAVQARCRAQS